ncbi:MAG: spermidine synthase [Bauldia sp.]
MSTATGTAIRAPGATPLPSPLLYLAVGLVAGAVIAFQIFIMRVFAVGSWTHFGSFVVALAMLGFGLASAVMALAEGFFQRRWRGISTITVTLFGPLMAGCHILAQQNPFNPIFLVSDPVQKWNLALNFVLYFIPFLSAAVFIGTVFLKSASIFGRVYFADLAGAGLCGLLVLGGMFLFPPENLILVPLLVWFAGGVSWLLWIRNRGGLVALAIAGLAALGLQFVLPPAADLTRIAVSDYKGVSYARRFPDATEVYASHSPFGDLQIYQSSYLHFAPGLSDNAAFNIPEMPSNAFLGMYIDSDGPIGIMRQLPPEQTAYFRYLPMYYPFLLEDDPSVFVVQFGGGISTAVALASGASAVTAAEANPAVLAAMDAPVVRAFTGDLLADPRLDIVPYEGRLFLGSTDERFDIIDLSLADSVGLSSPGGFAIAERYGYTREAMATYMRALSDGGILSVTVWNREEPPKSVLRLYATMAAAARDVDPGGVANSFYVAMTYLQTATVLYKRGGFTAEEIAILSDNTYAMSFDEIYAPGMTPPDAASTVLAEYYEQIFGTGDGGLPAAGGDPLLDPGLADPAGDPLLDPALVNPAGGSPMLDPLLTPAPSGPQVLPATEVGRLAWQALVADRWDAFAEAYVFDVDELTNNRPYFAAYVHPGDLTKTLDRLELFQDDWGYLSVWATLLVAGIAALLLLFVPVLFGWRTIFSRYPGKLGTLLYFACLGFGYMLVEVGMISKFILALSTPTVSASVLITGMLVFSGVGSLVSERFLDRARRVMPFVFAAIGALLIGYSFFLDPVLDWIGTFPYAVRLVLCLLLIAPPAFLMGFPLATGMSWLGRLKKEHLFIWAWGINGSFSVIASAAIPVLATSFGLTAVVQFAGVAYLIAIPAFFALLLPFRGALKAAAA